jgi:4-amino-4-deoxy-L-arabinose transferase-like glycosyltransferase
MLVRGNRSPSEQSIASPLVPDQPDRVGAFVAWLAAAGLVLLGAAAQVWLSQTRSALVLIPLGGALAFWPLLRKWLGKLSGRTIIIPPVALALTFSLGAASVVAQVAERDIPYDTYWPAFGLWLAALALPVVATFSPSRSVPEAWAALKKWVSESRASLAVLFCVFVVAAVVRLVNLSSIPYPFSGDEAAHAVGGAHVLDGSLKNMFISWFQGQPTLYYFSLAGMEKVFGATIFGARVYGALLGVLSVGVLYVFLRQAFDGLIAAVGSVYLAFYHFHVHYSRQDLNNVGSALMGAVVVLFIWRAVQHGRTRDFLLSGLAAGVALYIEAGCRVLLLVIAVVILVAILQNRPFLARNYMNLGVLLAGFLVAAAPIGWFWLHEQNAFMDRLTEVGIFQSGWFNEQREAGRSALDILWSQTTHAFGGFGYYHDPSPHYQPPISLVDRLSVLPLVVGAAVALRRFWEPRYAPLLALFVGVVASGGILTIGPPTSQRIVGATVPVAAFVAIGLVTTARFAFRRWRPLVVPAVLLALATLVAYNVHFYFFRYAQGDYFSSAETRLMQTASQYLNTLPEGTVVYWYGGPRLFPGAINEYLAPRQLAVDVRAGDGQLTPDIDPGGRPVAFVLLPHREADMAAVLAACPGGVRKDLGDPAKATNFTIYVPSVTTKCEPIIAQTASGARPITN